MGSAVVLALRLMTVALGFARSTTLVCSLVLGTPKLKEAERTGNREGEKKKKRSPICFKKSDESYSSAMFSGRVSLSADCSERIG